MKRIFFILLTLVITLPVAAHNFEQNAQRFNPDEYKKQLENYISQKAGFTDEEATKFFPLYHEMKNKQRELAFKSMELKRKQNCNMTDKEYADIIAQITKLDIQTAELAETYYKKMYKVVSARKVFIAMQAEDWFHRDMIKRFTPQGPPQGKNNRRQK